MRAYKYVHVQKFVYVYMDKYVHINTNNVTHDMQTLSLAKGVVPSRIG